jgi:hypothetical protein
MGGNQSPLEICFRKQENDQRKEQGDAASVGAIIGQIRGHLSIQLIIRMD